MLGWRRVETKYCQIVSFENRVKRFIYGCCCKIFNETFDDSVNIDEFSVVVRLAGYKNYRKSSSDILRAILAAKLGSRSIVPLRFIYWVVFLVKD